MSDWFDRLTLILLVATAGLLAGDVMGGHRLVARAWVPLLLPSDPPGSLHAPEADQQAIRARAASVGAVLTIEDLVRVALALETGRAAEVGLEELPPLTEDERAALRALLEAAAGHRDALLQAEGDLAQAEGRLGDAASRLAATLTPAQRRWILDHRDAVSVGDIESAYWAETAEALR